MSCHSHGVFTVIQTLTKTLSLDSSCLMTNLTFGTSKEPNGPQKD